MSTIIAAEGTHARRLSIARPRSAVEVCEQFIRKIVEPAENILFTMGSEKQEGPIVLIIFVLRILVTTVTRWRLRAHNSIHGDVVNKASEYRDIKAAQTIGSWFENMTNFLKII